MAKTSASMDTESTSVEQKGENEDGIQLEDSSKRQKLIDETLEDRISALPDSILLHILCLLNSTRDAIKTGILSKRWEYLWTSVPILIFNQCEFDYDDFVPSVDRTLVHCRHNKLKSFKIRTDMYHKEYQSKTSLWIRYAVGCNVEELVISTNDVIGYDWFQLPEFLFKNSYFTNLYVDYCDWRPAGVISWKNLRTLCIGHESITQKLIRNILSGSPLLETLKLYYCFGFHRLDIDSTSLRTLVFDGYNDYEEEVEPPDVVKIRAPKILSLKVKGDLSLWKVILLDMSSLVSVKLDYSKSGYVATTHDEAEEEMLNGFIQKLQHVKEIEIGRSCFEVLSRLKAKGFTFPSNVKLPFVTSLLLEGRDLAEPKANGQPTTEGCTTMAGQTHVVCTSMPDQSDVDSAIPGPSDATCPSCSNNEERADAVDAVTRGQTNVGDTVMSEQSDVCDSMLLGQADVESVILGLIDDVEAAIPQPTDVSAPSTSSNVERTDVVDVVMLGRTNGDTVMSGEKDVSDSVLLGQTDVETAIPRPNDVVETAISQPTDIGTVILGPAISQPTDVFAPSTSGNVERTDVSTAMLEKTDADCMMLEQTDIGKVIPSQVDDVAPSTSSNVEKSLLELCNLGSETCRFWRGHSVSASHVELLLAVEQKYPETFGRLRVRAERVWETYLGEFGRVITSFFKTSVSDLNDNIVGALREDLNDLGMYGFDVTWALERLQKVGELCFGEPLQQELVVERDKKAAEVAAMLGVDYDELLHGSLGFGLLEEYKVPL